MAPNRRRFLQALAGSATLPALADEPVSKPALRLGLIADVHKDIIHDADERLTRFVETMTREKVDAIIQLGDFCIPKPANREFLAIFERFPGPRFHVLGNHDMDGGFSRQQAVEFLGMKSRYGSFDLGGCHFIYLDGNDRPEDWGGGYPAHIAADQLEWLREDLARTDRPTYLLSHQSLERPGCIDNQDEVRRVLEAARDAKGRPKAVACLNGHWHIDHHRSIGGIRYLHLNSAAYFWMGGKYRFERLPEPLARRFPTVASTAPYRQPLFAILEIGPDGRDFRLQGRESEWLGPSPAELGYASKQIEPAWVRPAISAVTVAGA